MYALKQKPISVSQTNEAVLGANTALMIVKKKGGYYVVGESGRNLGGPYSKEKAKDRLRQVEYFKKKNK